MSTIKYISLSDLHFGEEDSLLTNLKPGCDEVDPTEASPVLKALMECLKNLVNDYNKGAKPTLILNGDVLELALAKTEEAGMVFQRFLEGVMAPGAELFSEIFCLPGNHDHHLWEMAREAQYSGFLQRHSAQFIGKPIPRPWHTTKLFCEGEAHPVHSALLDAFVTTSNPPGAVNIQIAYPNLGLLSKNGKRCVVFHHGHFTEDIYWMTSKVKRWIFNEAGEPFHVWDLEK